MSFKPAIAQDSPYVKEEKAGTKRSWCSCGLSITQPFCDGSHRVKNTGMRPLSIICDEDAAYAWCGCKQTKTPPYCDGTHARLSQS